MLPIRDSVRRRRFPLVNSALIALNVLVFVGELAAGPAPDGLVRRFALVPAELTDLGHLVARGGWPLLTVFTAMFLHGGGLHLGGNMLYLWIFGDNVEDLLGRGRYLIFFLLAGVAGMAAHVLAEPLSPVPTIGASGAVAGVLGAYMVSFPRARVLTLVPLVVVVAAVQVPAVLYLAFWFFLQLFSGYVAGRIGFGQPVAWWAHVGGFLAGMALSRWLARREPRPDPV